MQIVIRQSDAGSTKDVSAIAAYDDSVTVDAAAHGLGMIVVKNVPPSRVRNHMGADHLPVMLLDAQWLAENRPQGFPSR